MKRSLRRAAAASAAACFVLFTLANPAAAATLELTIEVEVGALNLNPSGTIDLEEDEACSAPEKLHFKVHVDTTAKKVKILEIDGKKVKPILGTDYVIVFDDLPVHAIAGDYVGGHPSSIGTGALVDMRVGLHLDIYELEEEPCVAGDLLCSVAVRLNLTGSYVTDLDNPVVNDTITLSGSSIFPGIAADPTCSQGPSQILGDSVTASFSGTVNSIV